MKEILIITSYFPPEIGAASNRIFHLAEGLKNRNFRVSVITPLPNYPTGKIFKSYRRKFSHSSNENGILVHRLWIYATVSKNKVVRLFAMLSYSLSLIWYFLFNEIPKTVIVQSPPLLVAFTCCTFLRSKKRKLILNVSDLWPIAGLELGALKKNFSYRILERIERSNYRKANLILGQSEEILTHIKTLFPNKKTFLYRNYPDFESPEINAQTKNNLGKISMVYAGLLGVAQGILKLCQELNYQAIEFHIYGSGSEQLKIENYINAHPELPIRYHGEVSRDMLHKSLIKYDIGIIPLLNRIYGSVPSKIFEYAKLGLPMLYFGGGEGETIIKEHRLGWVAKAGDYEDLNSTLSILKKTDFNNNFKNNIKTSAMLHFDFDKQLDELVKEF
ncbi:glycosyltransferase family 4 protein [Gelidibacter maritimus]|uniref:Glycosyltransferase family 4 protein n=1 Tax=Gelidibacter maritimus TaxID=2761487 RepID=A0A7W2M3D6_9FLAO|nr:glycosyltransferase family 4 protein [Gelidibacter maritimus]MBA6151920.1 glycosyltransferase family 4 protein [Gelidibacter maritimus]